MLSVHYMISDNAVLFIVIHIIITITINNKKTLQWRHNDGVSNHQPHDCLLNRLFRRRSKKTSKLRVTGLCEGNSPVTGEFPAQRASNAVNVFIWWRHHAFISSCIALVSMRNRTAAAPSRITQSSSLDTDLREARTTGWSRTGKSILTDSGSRLNIKTVFPRYGDSHVNDKTVGETV